MTAKRAVGCAVIVAGVLLLAACGSDSSVLSSTSTTARPATGTGATTGPASGASGGSGASAAARSTASTTGRVTNATGPDGYGVTECPPVTGTAGPVRAFAAPFKRGKPTAPSTSKSN